MDNGPGHFYHVLGLWAVKLLEDTVSPRTEGTGSFHSKGISNSCVLREHLGQSLQPALVESTGSLLQLWRLHPVGLPHPWSKAGRRP